MENFDRLKEKAVEASKHAYCKYSNFHVGAAAMEASGEIFTGCNVENSSYGATICAERVAITKMVSEKGPNVHLKAIAIYGPDLKTPLMACGICRQVMAEFGKKDTVVFYGCPEKWVQFSLDEILPGSLFESTETK